MRLHRFYIQGHDLEGHFLSGDAIELNDENIRHQLLKVFRYKVGQNIILFDGDGFDYFAILENLSQREQNEKKDKKLGLKIIKKEQNNNSPKREVTLCQSLIKKDNFELIVQKTAELGVSKIVPILSDRSEKKSLNSERLNKIAIEAAEQSGQKKVTQISEVVSLEDFFINNSSHVVVFHPEGKPFHEHISKIELKKDPLTIFIGPEGGWNDGELEMFKKHNAEIITLGKNILRSETAAIVANALFLLL